MNISCFDELYWMSLLCLTLLKCVKNALNPTLWYTVLIFLVLSTCSLGILYAIQYFGGGVAYVIKNIISALNSIKHFFDPGSTDWDVQAIDALAALVDGTCSSFKHPGALIRYYVYKLFISTTCKKIQWYESITLTRVIIVQPFRALFPETNKVPLKYCHLNKVTDMCAWIIGTESLLMYMIKRGVWIFVALVIFFPYFTFVLKIVKVFMKKLYDQVHEWFQRILPKLHMLHTNKKFVKILGRQQNKKWME